MTLPFSEHGLTKALSPCGEFNLETKKGNMSSFCGDSETLLDRMLEQCQNRVTARHPGFGRKLVPYFNNNNDDDGFTASGIRQQPKAETCGYSRSGQKPGHHGGYKRSPRSSRKANFANVRRGKKTESTNIGFYRYNDNKGGGNGGGYSSPTATMSSSSSYEEYPANYDCTHSPALVPPPPSLCSLFAGPICFNSPPPEALPMPTAVLLAKAMCLS
eukprot:g780.t1